MFKFFSALANLTRNTEALSASFAEANENFRRNLALDAPPAEVPALEHDEDDKPPRRNGRKVEAK